MLERLKMRNVIVTSALFQDFISVHADKFDSFTVVKRNEQSQSFSLQKIQSLLFKACIGLHDVIDPEKIIHELHKNVYSGISTKELERALVLSVLPFIEEDPAYNIVAMRLLLASLYKESFGFSVTDDNLNQIYSDRFSGYLKAGVAAGLLSQELIDSFDLDVLAQELRPERDHLFEYMGLQTIVEKYLLRVNNRKIEAPQYFWMRVAMGIALREAPEVRHQKVIEFYTMYSELRFVSGTPTLLHSGTIRPQLSSCYLTTVTDDLYHIFKCLGDNAQMSKWSGGVANDWTNIRATGSNIGSINVNSQGVVPFLKLVNDVTSVINRSGKRRGATCVYLESWHLDVEDFLDLRRNTGDERRRAHDINTANWIPDLLMKRIEQDAEWTLFSPDETPELHGLYGKAFEEKYSEYERKVAAGEIVFFKKIQAKQLWKKMLARLFETGHPWVTFKDSCNVRSPQDHVGVVHSSNLCTEITLNTSADETAVCNLGSINLARHMKDGMLDMEKLQETVTIAINMLDNVIDINYYPTIEGENSNLKHRPIGLGVMGLQDALYQANLSFDSQEALEFCDATQEAISYHAIMASSILAKERGAYESYTGSKWDRGIFPIDTLDLLAQERGQTIDVNRTSRLDWTPVREHVREHGMRNSNTMAIAPTATIANISGCFPCIEPIYKNLYVKANQQGEFTIINRYLISDLKQRGLWNESVREQMKFYDGSIQPVAQIPDELKHKYKTAFELDAEWMIEFTAARSKWIDQSQSHNVFMEGASGKKLNDVYFKAWKMGVKTTYYLRTMGASQIEKSTLDAKKYGFTQKRGISSVNTSEDTTDISKLDACSIDNPDCESCQ